MPKKKHSLRDATAVAALVNAEPGREHANFQVDGQQVEDFWCAYPLNENHPVNVLIFKHTPERIKKVLKKVQRVNKTATTMNTILKQARE